MTQESAQNSASAQRNDAQSVVKMHWDVVYRFMVRLTANSHDAEEMTQEAFLRALQKPDLFRQGSNMRAWLIRIAINSFLDTRRRRRPVQLDETEVNPAGNDESVSAPLERAELAGHLQKAMMQLSETQRVVFLLHTTEKLGFKEIAEMIGTTDSTARWHMLQARQQLLKLLEGKL